MKSQNPEWRRGSLGWLSQAYGSHVRITSASDHYHIHTAACFPSITCSTFLHTWQAQKWPPFKFLFPARSADFSWTELVPQWHALLFNAVPFRVSSCEDLGAASSGILLPVPGESVARLPPAQLLKSRKCFILTAGSPVVPGLLSADSGTCSSLSYHLVLGNSLCLCSRL